MWYFQSKFDRNVSVGDVYCDPRCAAKATISEISEICGRFSTAPASLVSVAPRTNRQQPPKVTLKNMYRLVPNLVLGNLTEVDACLLSQSCRIAAKALMTPSNSEERSASLSQQLPAAEVAGVNSQARFSELLPDDATDYRALAVTIIRNWDAKLKVLQDVTLQQQQIQNMIEKWLQTLFTWKSEEAVRAALELATGYFRLTSDGRDCEWFLAQSPLVPQRMPTLGPMDDTPVRDVVLLVAKKFLAPLVGKILGEEVTADAAGTMRWHYYQISQEPLLDVYGWVSADGVNIFLPFTVPPKMHSNIDEKAGQAEKEVEKNIGMIMERAEWQLKVLELELRRQTVAEAEEAERSARDIILTTEAQCMRELEASATSNKALSKEVAQYNEAVFGLVAFVSCHETMHYLARRHNKNFNFHTPYLRRDEEQCISALEFGEVFERALLDGVPQWNADNAEQLGLLMWRSLKAMALSTKERLSQEEARAIAVRTGLWDATAKWRGVKTDMQGSHRRYLTEAHYR